jgi:hypothetical protein
MEKPVFIPLNKEYFEQFESGAKTTEYRKYGNRWNLRNCTPGRAVTLSLGYGKKRRLSGVIKSFRTTKPENCQAKEDFYKIYGNDCNCLVAEIEITLNH